MRVERDWEYENGDLHHEASTITGPVSDEENFRCRCGDSFDSKEEAETHLADLEEEPGEEQADATDDGYESIEIKRECPEFMGIDLEVYGPFEKGDTVVVPEDNAEILVNRGTAERIE